MRIAYLTHYAELYGANRSLLDLMLELRSRGEVEPFVLLPREGPITERLQAEKIPFQVIPWEPWMSDRRYMGRIHHRIMQHLGYERAARKRAMHNRSLLPAVLRTIEEQRIGLIHVNSAAVGITALLLEQCTTPLVWHIRELPEHQYMLTIDAGRRRYGQALRKAARLIAISKAVQEDIRRYAGSGVHADLIYNGVLRSADQQRLASKAMGRWTATGPFTFVLAGLIHASKGQEEAIRAFALLRQHVQHVRLVLAGDGKADRLHALIQQLGVGDGVVLTGFVKDLEPLLLSSHALLMCSRNEAMGRVTVEGMSSGLPVIGHASGGTLELITEGVTGLFYPGGAEALAERMLALVNDRSRARTLGEAAMRDAAERFNVERYATEVLEVYRSLQH